MNIVLPKDDSIADVEVFNFDCHSFLYYLHVFFSADQILSIFWLHLFFSQ